MSLFVCTECGCIENVNRCNYFTTRERICSDCDADIGEWHGKFRKTWPSVGMMLDAEGFIYGSYIAIPSSVKITHVYTENGLTAV